MAIVLQILIGIALLFGAWHILANIQYGIYWGWALLFPGFGFISKALTQRHKDTKTQSG